MNICNQEWTVKDGNDSFDAAQLGVLMDIRNELRRLNQLLHCSNFLSMPYKLERIARNTAKQKRRS